MLGEMLDAVTDNLPPFALARMKAPGRTARCGAARKRHGGPVGRNAPIKHRRFDASFQRLDMAPKCSGHRRRE
ncbi:hypothetical protein [Methylocystis sp.]|uniref:hypothetical protein n=1 Tax=Methylocystis sp. TaxID=1911079 RepID=UPI003DA30E12